jgi:hypothetical protein
VTQAGSSPSATGSAFTAQYTAPASQAAAAWLRTSRTMSARRSRSSGRSVIRRFTSSAAEAARVAGRTSTSNQLPGTRSAYPTPVSSRGPEAPLTSTLAGVRRR